MTHEYVIVLADAPGPGGQWLVIQRKDRPKWQAGLLNLPGGKLRGPETPNECARRELREEAGIEPRHFMKCGELEGLCADGSGDSYVVHCIRAPLHAQCELLPAPEETEAVFWLQYEEALAHPHLIANLRDILPRMLKGETGWRIEE